jgi:hypothetical protein
MKLAELSPEILDQIKARRWDRIIEKHESPETWESVFRYAELEFIEVEDRWVLLPLEQEHYANLTILRTIWSVDGDSLTLFLKDTTFYDDPFFSGYIAVCDCLPGENFFIAILYHEWFIID